MTIKCAAPDASLGVAIRLSTYLDCQARALGENGFQAVAGGPVAAGLLSGVVTIFVALIGYRLIMGRTPDLRDGVGWAVRLGLVLTLATSWPAFQTLIYRVAVDGPSELAAVLLPANGLPSEDLNTRVQLAYDTIRLGRVVNQPLTANQPTPGSPGPVQPGQPQPPAQQQQATPVSIGQAPLPQTASVFVIATLGVVAALRVAIGLLLAIGPLVVMALLFDATLGVFSGWVRAIAGLALALLAATVVTAIDLVMVEGEFANLQTYAQGLISEAVDPQALTTIVLLFVLVMLVAVLAAMRVASAFRLPLPSGFQPRADDRPRSPIVIAPGALPQTAMGAGATPSRLTGQARTASVADALAATVRREQSLVATSAGSSAPEAPSRRVSIVEAASRTEPGLIGAPLGVAGRRSIGRRTRSAATRDRTA